jgi:hypothetical protein
LSSVRQTDGRTAAPALIFEAARLIGVDFAAFWHYNFAA